MSMETTYRPVKSFHPGETLDEKLQELEMSVEDFSAKAGLSAWVVKSFIGGDMSVTADMALAFEQVTHIPAHYWLNAQRNYDEYLLKNSANMYRNRLSKSQEQMIIIFEDSIKPAMSKQYAYAH